MASIWDRIKAFNSPNESPNVIIKKVPVASTGISNILFTNSFNGEKNLGEIGPAKTFLIDYNTLRARSWQAVLESEVAQTVIQRTDTWVVGKGLKLQCQPERSLLELEGIKLQGEDFNNNVEARFNSYRKSKTSDYSGMQNLDMIASDAYRNSIIGGDVLVILRYVNDTVKVQLIDGAHIQSPGYGTEYSPQELINGNQIINGIEFTPSGEHVRYYVRQQDLTYQTIEAKGKKSGLQMAFLVNGLKYRIDNKRCIPLVSAVLEKLKKLERYSEATLGSAEERQKISLAIEHDIASTGENPFGGILSKAHDIGGNEDIPEDINGNALTNTVAATTNKQVVNMPQGAKLKAIESKNELYFKDFYSVNVDLICATLGIPPEVAMSKYDSNFSASRAALKDWEHTLQVKRTKFSFEFYQPIYNFWLETEILKNKIQAPGYLEAKLKRQDYILDAYRGARFVGAPVPHIDPLKEVNAERAKLGTSGADLPLTTLEAATEALNGGESDGNMEQYAKELLKAKGLKIITPIAPPVLNA